MDVTLNKKGPNICSRRNNYNDEESVRRPKNKEHKEIGFEYEVTTIWVVFS